VTTPVLYALVGVALFSLGVGGLITAPHLLRKVLAFNIAGSGVFLFLAAMAARTPGPFPDPVPHAMVLTGIVVAVSATALALLLICLRHETSEGSATNRDDGP
jgi:multicomponent Na+:H+ antiporter subunit C